MKRWIHASEDVATIKSNADIVAFLDSKGIDTTKHRYKLKYTFYDRFDTEREEITFTCPGDYLALFATKFATVPSYNRISDWYGNDLEYFTEIINDNPTYKDLYNYGDSNEWFDREEYGGIELTNLDTGDVLVKSDDYRYQEYDIDWED